MKEHKRWHGPREQEDEGLCGCYNPAKRIVLLCSFIFVKWEWNSSSQSWSKKIIHLLSIFILSWCVERSASFLTASEQRQTSWRCSQLPEDTRMFWVKLMLYSGLGSPTFPVISIHHISFGCISLWSLNPSLYVVYNSENWSEQEGF